jgi:hypothetical protein
MPTITITKATIARLKAPDPSGNQVLYWDTDLKGFGVLCSGVSTTKTYVVQCTLPRTDGRTRRITVGSVHEISLEKAQAEAAELIHQMRQGIDPKAVRRATMTDNCKQKTDQKPIKPMPIKRKGKLLTTGEVATWLAKWVNQQRGTSRRPPRSSQRKTVSQYHELYRHYDADGMLLYIGASHDALDRLRGHRSSSGWYRLITKMTIERFPTLEDLVRAEKETVTREKPPYNTQIAEPIRRRRPVNRVALTRLDAELSPRP